MDDLIAKIRAEIDMDERLANGEDEQAHNERHWPHRTLPMVEAHRTILNWAMEATKMCVVSNGELGRPGDHMMGDIGRWTIEALAKGYGIEVEA